MKVKKLNIVLLCAVALTLLAIGLHKWIPDRSYTLVPSDWRSELFFAYSPDEVGIASWVDEEAYHFHCKVQDSDAAQHCGVNFFFDWNWVNGVDLSKFENIQIQAEYSGEAPRVRIFLRNYNPEYGDPDDANSAKYIAINLLTSEFQQSEPVTISFHEFRVANWWLDQYQVERKYMPVEFGNVSTIGFDFGTYLDKVEEVDFKIESVKFTGPLIEEEYWYLGILVFWMVVILLLVGYQYFSMWRQSRVYSKVITELVTDKAQLEEESDKLQKLSNLDRLTGALNRLGLEKSIDRIITGRRSRVISLILMDVDHFKRVNDQRGHDVGDEVLKRVVELIQSSVRDNDVLGRWGGEEFVLITPTADKQAAYNIAEKIREVIAAHTFEEDHPLKVTASFGVTSLHPDEDFENAFKRADVALYRAKAQGRNCTVIADE